MSATSAFRRCRRPTGRGHGTGEGTSSRGNPSPSSAPVGARSTASRTKRTPRILRDTISSRSHSPLRKGVGSVAGVATDRTLTGDGAAGTVHASLEARTPLAYGFSKTSRLARSGAVRFRPPRPGRSTGKLPFENRTSSKTAAAVSSAGTSVMPPPPFRKGAIRRSKFFRTNRDADAMVADTATLRSNLHGFFTFFSNRSSFFFDRIDYGFRRRRTHATPAYG